MRRVAEGTELYFFGLSVPAPARHVLTVSRLRLQYFPVLHFVCMVIKCLSVLFLWRTSTLELHIKHKQLLLTLMNK